ncbi:MULTISPECIES: hypothetical protein [Halobacterium]|uniref:hypothetical protein n=1 Tax=Halobacterium TaxID=2239 RepID=UPI000AE5C76F|nr:MULTISPECIES: hypothetical protein [Halobacterium]MCG1002869.1 hypothetical protein [Halobacterium noricense]
MASNTPTIVVAVTVAVIVGFLFLQPVMTAAQDNTGEQNITNETVVAESGEYVDLDGYSVNTGSETVYAQNSSGDYVEATSGTDYEINYDRGELQALNSSTLIQDGEELRVSYTYQASGGTTALIAGFIPVMFVLLLFVTVAMKVTDFL